MLSDELRTIAARLVKFPETQIDGQLLLSKADEVAKLESRVVTIEEKAGALCMTLNDQMNELGELAEALKSR